MVRALVLVTSLLAFGSASALQINPIVTGADMAGMQVTANFSDGSSETVTWATTMTDGGIPNGEGFRGAATGANWSLAQQGFTDGGFDNGSVLGAWTLVNNTNLGLVSLVIDALAGKVLFDIIGLQNNDTAEYTPGSSVGRGFQSQFGEAFDAAVASYSALVSSPDLWGTLTVNFGQAGFGDWGDGVLAAGQRMQFVADTDKIPLPAPALLMLLGLAGLVARSRAVR